VVEDKITKNHRKTLGLLRDLKGAKSVGVIAEYPERGIVEIARPVGVVAAITPSTNPGATPANKIINALKGRNAVIVAPSPKGASTCAALVGYVNAELAKVGAPHEPGADAARADHQGRDARADAANPTWWSPPARRPTCARPMPAARRPSASAPAMSPASSTPRPISPTRRRRSPAPRPSTTPRAVPRRTAW
jgi:hypothetical protein